MVDEIVTVEQDLDKALFEQLEDEPTEWYDRFMDYFVALGSARTFRTAYLLHNECMGDKAGHSPSYNKWREAARDYRWKVRAAAYDHELQLNAARQVEKARGLLMQASVKAVEALEDSLDDPKHRVAASKAILDRAGLPSAKEVKHSVESFSADELSQAAEEIEAWENQMNGSNGSNVPEA